MKIFLGSACCVAASEVIFEMCSKNSGDVLDFSSATFPFCLSPTWSLQDYLALQGGFSDGWSCLIGSIAIGAVGEDIGWCEIDICVVCGDGGNLSLYLWSLDFRLEALKSDPILRSMKAPKVYPFQYSRRMNNVHQTAQQILCKVRSLELGRLVERWSSIVVPGPVGKS